MTILDSVTLYLRTQLGRLVEFWRQMTSPERLLAAMLLALLLTTPVAGLLADSGTAWGTLFSALLAAWLLVPVLADAVMARAMLRGLQAALLEANTVQPTGAPRVAEAPCSHGDMHRFVYGPDGWRPAGPAVDSRPEEARTP